MKLTRAILLFAVTMAIVLASPLADAQQPAKVARIGWLSRDAPTAPPGRMDEFRVGLRELGYVEGQTFVFEARYSSGNDALWPELVADLVRAGVDVIVAGPAEALLVAKTVTNRVPIIMTPSVDPVGMGAVASLAHPGGNVTGITEMAPELTPKRLQLLKELIPTLSRVAILCQPGALSEETFRQMLTDTRAVAQPLGIQLQVVEAKGVADLDVAFAAMLNERAEALIVLINPTFFVQRRQIIERAAKQRLPAIYEWKEFVRSGGLISYGADVSDVYRRAAGLADRILKGAKPGDLTVEGPTRFEMAVNLKAASALGLTLTQSVRARAVEAIE